MDKGIVNSVRTRDQYFQWVRGICMVTVVLIHCKNSVTTGGWELGYWLSMRQITNFAVATFVFMAGYFAKLREINGDYCKRLIRLIIPYLFWTVFYSLTNGIFNPYEIGRKIISGTASVQLYYMLVIIELTIITPILWKAIERKAASCAIILVSPIYITTICLIQYSIGTVILWKGRDFAAWLIFYYIGMLAQKYGWKTKTNIVKAIAYAIAFFGLSIFEGIAVFEITKNSSLAVSQLKISSFCFALSSLCNYMTK